MMAVPLRVLIVEDRPEDAELELHELRRSGFVPQWQRVETLADFAAGLESQPEIVLSDFTMPQLDAMLALRYLREKQPDIPFILVSGTIGEERAVAAMKAGATDYVPKDRPERLAPVVVRALDEYRLRRESKVAREQLKLQATALEAAANGIIITDRSGVILWVNPAVTAMTGYSREELLGRNPRIFKSGQHSPEFFRDYWNTIQSGKVWHGELTNKRKDGSLYFTMQSVTPLQNGQGEITHFIAIQQDVTESKKLLEQFLQAQKMEAFGRLAGGVAHDFNNLLTVICGFSEIILNTLPENSPPRDMLVQVKKAGERAAGLTQQLLAFSRKQILRPQLLDLNTELAELKKMLGRLIGEDVDLIWNPSPAACLIKADPTQLQQVIVNLAVNARDAMPKGGTLTLATHLVDVDEAFILTHPKAHAGPHVLLEVCDTGCGMTPEVLARIFEPFFTTKDPGKGTGLGLATVIGIVEQSGGFIGVESQPGQGTLFHIYFPRASVSNPDMKARPSSPGLRRGGETILLVEDDDGVRSLTSMILRSGGYTVLEASDGGSGLEVFAQHRQPIHLLLTDVVMPHMDGCHLAELLTTKSTILKVLYMSGYLDDAIVRHGIQERDLPFLHKPFPAEVLLKRVREVLDQPQTAAMKGEPCAAAV